MEKGVCRPVSVCTDGPTGDAFGRLRVANPVNLFESSLHYDTKSLLWETVEVASGTATHVPTKSAVNMTITGNGDSVVRQTREYFRYQPGKSQLIFMTGIIGADRKSVV